MFDNKEYSKFLFKNYYELFDLKHTEFINVVLIGSGWTKLVETFLEKVKFFYYDNVDVLEYIHIDDISTKDGSLYISYEYKLKDNIKESRLKIFEKDLEYRIKNQLDQLIKFSKKQCEYCGNEATQYNINQWVYTICKKCLSNKFSF